MRFSIKEALKNAERVLVYDAGALCCLSSRNARPVCGEILAPDLSFLQPFQHRGRLPLLSARSGKQRLFDNHQIGQGKQSM